LEKSRNNGPWHESVYQLSYRIGAFAGPHIVLITIKYQKNITIKSPINSPLLEGNHGINQQSQDSDASSEGLEAGETGSDFINPQPERKKWRLCIFGSGWSSEYMWISEWHLIVTGQVRYDN
jgi:hypothetical protein